MKTRGLKAKKPSLNLFVFRARAPAGRRAFRCNSQPLCASTAAKLPLCPAPSLRRQLISASIPRAFARVRRRFLKSAARNGNKSCYQKPQNAALKAADSPKSAAALPCAFSPSAAHFRSNPSRLRLRPLLSQIRCPKREQKLLSKAAKCCVNGGRLAEVKRIFNQ